MTESESDKPYVPRTPNKDADPLYEAVVALSNLRSGRKEIARRLDIPEARVKAILDLYRARKSAGRI